MNTAKYWRRKAKHLTERYNRFYDFFLRWTGQALDVLPPTDVQAMLRRAEQKASRAIEPPQGPQRYFRGGEVRVDLPLARVGAKRAKTCYGDRKNTSGFATEMSAAVIENAAFVPTPKPEPTDNTAMASPGGGI